MKAKDWARAAVSERDWWRPGPDFLIDFDLLRGHVADAIRAAVEEERETCALLCDAIADDKHDQFKGRGQHSPANPNRADTYTEGESGGADLCAVAIRAMKDK